MRSLDQVVAELPAAKRAQVLACCRQLIAEEIGRDATMADHPHTIDRWDHAIGETLVEQIAAVDDFVVCWHRRRRIIPF